MENVTLVTGGSRGIGRAICLRLAADGFTVAIVYRADENAARQTADAVRQTGGRAEAIQADVGLAADRARLVEAVRSRFDRCDLLVNNAGAAPKQRLDVLQTTEESYDRVMAVNLKGPFFLTQQVAGWMIEQVRDDPQRRCRIVNIGSISAYTSSPSRGEYCLSKAGMRMMTLLFADRLAEYGIGVFEIQPGIIATDMTAGVKEKYDKLIADGLTPIQRWGQPDDVARAVSAVARGDFDFAPGQAFHVDGGFHMRRL
ncbi:MAG: 3-ketoacyl-ACP reductase [Pirellulales bacterium]|nr:3-ketoacyl-ACP reductase [Pirellulales bacterium]